MPLSKFVYRVALGGGIVALILGVALALMAPDHLGWAVAAIGAGLLAGLIGSHLQMRTQLATSKRQLRGIGAQVQQAAAAAAVPPAPLPAPAQEQDESAATSANDQQLHLMQTEFASIRLALRTLTAVVESSGKADGSTPTR